VRLAAKRLGATSSAGPVADDAGALVGGIVAAPVGLVAIGLAFGDAPFVTGPFADVDSTTDPGAAPPLHPIRLAPQITATYAARRTLKVALRLADVSQGRDTSLGIVP
jgi:hypothetical protein